MNLPASLFSSTWHWVAFALSIPVLYQVALKAPWKRLRKGTQLNLLLGFAVGLSLVWSLRAGVKPGLNLHMLGAMAVTLTLGPRLAIVALALALTGITVNGAIEWRAWPINFLLMAVVPVMIAHAIQRLVERRLPAHFFIFIFVIGFAGSALTIILQGALSSMAMVLAGAYSAEFLISEYLPYFLLLGFAEGWLSGALITMMVVYRPEWVVAFDDQIYLRNK
ncbi:MAG: energy-coupling factor ABC transporter permease [Azoarcus sp.]|nr:energy-coupling factor ABC transporter permease [Azoarcus sp.]